MHRRQRVHLVRSLDGRGTGFADANVPNLAGLDQFGHCANGVFDGHIGVYAVLIVEIKIVGAQALEATVYGLTNVFRAAVHATRMRVVAPYDAKLAGQINPFTLALQSPPQQRLIGVWAVHVGCVEKSDTQLQRTVQRGNRFLLVDPRGVKVRHPHAAQPDGRNLRTVVTQLARDHNELS
ncbi:hypothetical protein ALQ16_204864 [Pseudomonas syringae pv. actinidiae]|nr:hypothetical protein ALQ16_204864 [Pseudomonas syringae pv. actinidiae]